MKAKNGSQASHAISSGSWRTIGRGRTNESGKKSPGEAKKFRIAAYIRLSPSGEDRLEGSLVSHPQRIKQFVESKNIQHNGQWGDIVEWYEDKDLSGKDMNRPAFQKLLRDVAAGHVNAVIVTELSRLNRKVRDFCEVWEFFKDHKVAFFSLKENFDTSTPMGELMLIQAMSFAQFERHTIVDRIKKGARARAERGLANGIIPLGFGPVEHRPNHRQVIESERAYVEMIFRKFLELKRVERLVTFLNKEGFRTKEYFNKKGEKVGGNLWTLSSIHALLTNRAYVGEREVNKRNRSLAQEALAEDERYFVVAAHWPALISKALFSDVQNLLEENRKKARKYVHFYRLTGLITCGECGRPMIGKSGTGRNGKHFYYGHVRKLTTAVDNRPIRCSVENIPALLLEEAIVDRVKQYGGNRAVLTELARESQHESKARIEHQKSLLNAKEQERRKLVQKYDNLIETLSETSDRNLKTRLSDKLTEMGVQLEAVQTATAELKAEFDRISNVIDVSAAFEMYQIFSREFDNEDVSVQGGFLRKFVKRLVIQKDGATAEIFGAPEIIPVPGVGGSKSSNKKAGRLITDRPLVRTVFKLVGAEGLEPPTLRL